MPELPRRAPSLQRAKRAHRSLLVAGLAGVIATWVVAWLGNWPAAMSPDSINQWAQLLTGRYDDWHPVVHTLFLRVLTGIWFSPASAVAAQLLAMAAVATLAVLELVRRGVGPGWVCLVMAGLAHPVHGAMLSVLWKDIPYAISLLALVIAVAQVSEPDLRDGRSALALLVVSALGVALFRHNGIVVALAGWVGAGVAACGGKRRGIAVAFAAFLAVYGGSRVVVWQLVGAERPRPTEMLAIPLQQVGAIVTAGGRVTPREAQLVAALLPLRDWQAHYHPRSVDELKFLPNFRPSVLADAPASYAWLWVRLCAANPDLALLGWARQTSVVWMPLQNAVATYPQGIVGNPFGLKSDPPIPRLRAGLTSFYHAWMRPPLVWIARPGVFNWALLALCVIAWRRARWVGIAPLMPVLAGTAMLLLLIPVPDFRFFYPTFAVLPWLWAYRCGGTRRPSPAHGDDQGLSPPSGQNLAATCHG